MLASVPDARSGALAAQEPGRFKIEFESDSSGEGTRGGWPASLQGNDPENT